jgi:hypothetical protein
VEKPGGCPLDQQGLHIFPAKRIGLNEKCSEQGYEEEKKKGSARNFRLRRLAKTFLV